MLINHVKIYGNIYILYIVYIIMPILFISAYYKYIFVYTYCRFAMRGAGGSFGVVTSITVKLYQKPRIATGNTYIYIFM